jgi:hypothetical protein
MEMGRPRPVESTTGAQTYAEPFGGKADEPFLICHREERSDVAIHLESFVDCRSRQASFAMTMEGVK